MEVFDINCKVGYRLRGYKMVNRCVKCHQKLKVIPRGNIKMRNEKFLLGPVTSPVMRQKYVKYIV